MKKLFALFGILICFTAIKAMAYEISADAQTKRIPAGTKLEVEMAKELSSIGAYAGDSFGAYLTRDVRTQTTMILPRGTIVRGNISRVEEPKRPYKAGILYLTFDHIVAPNGAQLPIQAGVSGLLMLDEAGGVKGGVNYGGKLKQNASKSGAIIKKAVRWGIDSGEDWFHGGKYLVTPFSAVAGSFAGGGYLVGMSIADLFKKGCAVDINKGTVFEITLLQPLDVPVSE